jgi:membrane-associated phospholipid phosphatase
MKQFFFLALFFVSLYGELPSMILPKEQKEYYSFETLKILLPSFSVAYTLAHSFIDEDLFQFYQTKIKSPTLDPFFSIWKLMGQHQAIVPYSFIGLYAGLMGQTPYGNFSKELLSRSAKAFIIGTIPLHIARACIGGSRPSNTLNGSKWSPFFRRHGVSGHTFTGAVLWITLAQMSENSFIKGLCYLTSTLTGLSRIHDKDHYPSQVALGWVMAFVACNAVSKGYPHFTVDLGSNTLSLSMDF